MLLRKISKYLLGVWVGGGSVAITLTIDSRASATADSIHLPLGEIIVHHMEIPVSTPWHSLHQSLPKVIERNRYLHNTTLLIYHTIYNKTIEEFTVKKNIIKKRIDRPAFLYRASSGHRGQGA